MKLIFVHGRAQQGKDPNQLQAEWENALLAGLSRAGLSMPGGVAVEFPYFGDHLDQLIRKIEAPLLVDVLTRGGAIDDPSQRLQAQLLLEMAAAANISDTTVQSYLDQGPQERGIENSAWVIATARALDHTPLGAVTLNRVTHDVSVYLANSGVRWQIDDLVKKALSPGPCVVVGHSLGSVIAYNVLYNTASTVDVRLYITVGSPLGLRSVRENIEAPLSMPPCAKAWFNARDVRDVVAAYPLDEHSFDISPPIENKSDVDNHTQNRHGIKGYLDDPSVARKIWVALEAE